MASRRPRPLVASRFIDRNGNGADVAHCQRPRKNFTDRFRRNFSFTAFSVLTTFTYHLFKCQFLLSFVDNFSFSLKFMLRRWFVCGKKCAKTQQRLIFGHKTTKFHLIFVADAHARLTTLLRQNGGRSDVLIRSPCTYTR